MRQFSNFNSNLCLSLDLNILFIGSTKSAKVFISILYIHIYSFIMDASNLLLFFSIKIKLKKKLSSSNLRFVNLNITVKSKTFKAWYLQSLWEVVNGIPMI